MIHTNKRKKEVLIVRVRAWSKETILPQRLDFVMNLIQKNVKVKYFDIQPERKLGYYLGYLFSFLYSYPKLLFTSCDSVILENPYLVIFSPIFKLRRKNIIAEYVDFYPANLNRLKKERFFRFQVAKIVCRIFHKFVDIITTESETGRRTLKHWSVPDEQLAIVPHGVNTQKMIFSQEQRSKLRKKYQISDSTLVIGYLGKMVKFYSLENILHSIALVNQQKYKIQTIFVGDGPFKENLEALSKELQLDVIFTGRIPHEEVFGYYSMMDLFIFPLNSLAIKIGEILSINGPILIVTRGMAEDWITDNANGIVAKGSKPIELKNAIERTIHMSPEARKKLSSNQREYALSHLDRRIIAKKYLMLV